MPTAICPKCNTPYVMGLNGTIHGCDPCLGVIRDANGYAWYPGELIHYYHPTDAPDTTVCHLRPTRPGAIPKIISNPGTNP